MAKRMMRAVVKLQLPDMLDEELLELVRESVDADAKMLAGEIQAKAKTSTAFQDYKGTSRESEYSRTHYAGGIKLRRSIHIKKSKFEDGGYLVYSKAPHAHLIEFGHTLVSHFKVLGIVDAHPFLRPAADAIIANYVSKKIRG